MSNNGKMHGMSPAGLLTPLNNVRKDPADQLEAGTTMDSEALQLAKSTADAVLELRAEMQQMREDMVKNAEEFKNFTTASMGTLQAGSAPAAAAPAAPTPAPTVPLSPAPTVPLSPDLAALSAIDQSDRAVSDAEIDATAESQPAMPLQNVRLKRRHLGGRNSGQDAKTLQKASSLSYEDTGSEDAEDMSSNFEDFLEGSDASGANNANGAGRRHRCEQCGNTFCGKYTLKTHMRSVHAGERPHPCGECAMAFIFKSKLEIHMRKHTGERPFKCDECGDAFKLKQHLTRHMRRHTGEKPYQCGECGNAFTQKRNLNLHMSKQHAGGKP